MPAIAERRATVPHLECGPSDQSSKQLPFHGSAGKYRMQGEPFARKPMTAVAFTINGKAVNVEAEPDTALLWVVREHLKLTGTKYGCGSGLCGACTVHIDG